MTLVLFPLIAFSDFPSPDSRVITSPCVSSLLTCELPEDKDLVLLILISCVPCRVIITFQVPSKYLLIMGRATLDFGVKTSNLSLQFTSYGSHLSKHLVPQILLSAYIPSAGNIQALLHGAHGLDRESNINQVINW